MSIEVMKQALEALEKISMGGSPEWANDVIPALRQAIAQAEKQEPVSRLYSIEPHGDGYAIYCGRDWQHHGMNIGHLTEVTPAAIKLIETALNQKTGQAEKQEPESYDETSWQMGYWAGKNANVNKFIRDACDRLDTPERKPRKEWVGLTDDEIETAFDESCHVKTVDPVGTIKGGVYILDVGRAIEAKLKEKNGG